MKGPLTLYVLVIIATSIGISVGPDSHLWWVPLIAGFAILPVISAVILAVMFGLDILWGDGDKWR